MTSKPTNKRANESANEHAYDRWSRTYDTGLNSTVASDDLAFPELWRHVEGQRVLEIGCGTGRHTSRLLDQKNEVVGIDLSSGMLAVARARMEGRAVRWIHGDVLTTPPERITEGRPFGAALSALVLEHISDLDGFFKKVGRLLLPSASFFISEIHPDRAKAGRLAHFIDSQSGDEVWLDSTAHGELTVEQSAKSAGFELVQSIDALGSSALSERNPGWAKYIGVPMVKMWELRWIGKN